MPTSRAEPFFFFTLALLERRRDLLVSHIDLLRSAFRKVQERRPFRVDAIVVPPDHLHCIWTLPADDSDFSTRWRLIKTIFSWEIPADERRSACRQARGERGLWQRRFWEHAIRDERDFQAHADYIHFNPVKHGYTDRVADWPHSSFHRLVREGRYPQHWAGGDVDFVAGDD